LIGVLGATGFTGKLVAEELARRRLPHRLGARNPEKLGALPAADGRESFVVDTNDAARLDLFMDGLDSVISTVGPFVHLGMPAVEAAVRSGVPYVDSTGEQEFMQAVYERFASAPVPLVPACGFDFIPQDLAAEVAMEDLGGDVAEVAVHTRVSGVVPSRGTARTTVALASSLAVEPNVRRVPFPSGVRTLLEFPWGDRAIARHARGARVVTTLSMPGVSPGLARFIPRVLPRLGPLVERLPEGPSPERRRKGTFELLAEAIGPNGRRAVVCTGHDAYGLTARFLVEAAMRVKGAGGLAPAEALPAAAFLDAVSGATLYSDLEWRRLPE
jgi:short subunit dehydrogenase-like uncharacterized protein